MASQNAINPKHANKFPFPCTEYAKYFFNEASARRRQRGHQISTGFEHKIKTKSTKHLPRLIATTTGAAQHTAHAAYAQCQTSALKVAYLNYQHVYSGGTTGQARAGRKVSLSRFAICMVH